MGFDPGLEIGKILSNDEINKIFEGIQQGGIRPSTKNNCIVLISDPSGKIYQDKWIDETRIDYTGQGPEGNQKIAYGNKTLQNANVDNKKLFFFEIIGSGKYLYQGECDLVGEWYESKQKDIKHKLRRVYMFPLKLRHKRFHITLTEIEQEKYEEDDQKFKSEFAKEYTKRYFSNDEKPYPTGPKKGKIQ